MAADADVVLGGEAPVERDLLGEEANVSEEGRVLAGSAAELSIPAFPNAQSESFRTGASEAA